jgi:P27 family predicted phage terminase small subunit
MGRAKLSKEAKIIKGTFRPCQEQEPTVEFAELDKMPNPPEGLGSAGKELWTRLGRQLVAAGVMTAVDLFSFTLLCESYDRAEHFQKTLTNNGKLSLEKAICDPGTAPLIRQLKFEREFVKKLLGDFGITPRSRNSVSPVAKKTLSKDEEGMKVLLGGLERFKN